MTDERQFTPEDRALFDAEVERLRRQELPRAHDEEIKAAAQRAIDRDLEQERQAVREELDTAVAEATTETVAEERAEARREVPSKLLLGLILLIILLLVLAVSGNLRIPFVSSAQNEDELTPRGNLDSVLGPTATPIGGAGLSATNAGSVAAPGSIIATPAGVDPFFQDYYQRNDGLRVFGLPIGPLQIVNNRRVQMFERARLEEWPENPDPRYQIQPGLIGREYTQGRTFPTQAFFTSRPGLWYFPETSHGVGGLFLEYWLAHGGLDIFGYPISDELPEVLEDGRLHTVQYFERARMELHPDRPAGQQVMLGLLGSAIAKGEPLREHGVVPAPTPVPLP
jgi:hypothetical protein